MIDRKKADQNHKKQDGSGGGGWKGKVEKRERKKEVRCRIDNIVGIIIDDK